MRAKASPSGSPSLARTRLAARSREPRGLPAALARVLDAPPREFSPAAIWWWSGEPLRRDRLRWQLERLVQGGVWNLVILNLAPSGPLFGSDADDPPFLSEAWWELLGGVCEDAAELGARLWLYDQLGFSGADLQARLVQERPEFGGLWLPADAAAGARDEVEQRGFDYLGADACATLLDSVHGEVERRLGRWLGETIAGFFQDELPALPTWSRDFARVFAERNGYELEGRRRELLWSGDGAAAERVRRDYHATRAALAEEAFFKPLNAWHERHGLICGCDQQDPARAGHPVEGVQLYADYARTHRWFGAPGSDHHGDARIHSSLAHLYGRPRVWIEAFHSSGWGGTLEETFDWLLPWLRAGATLYNPHAVYTTTKGGWWEWAPPSTDWRQPYWRHHAVFADAVARLCAGLSLGRHVCDVAVLLPTANAQAGARAGGEVDADAARAQRTYVELVGDMAWFHQRPGALDRLRRDADVIDDDSLQRAAVGDDGRLRVADEAYAAVVLPACTVLEDATAARLAAFAAAGGRVVAVGELPARAVGVAPEGADAPGLAALLAAFERGDAVLVDAGDDDALAAALATVEPRVESERPVLVREVGDTLVIFLTAASPSASAVEVGDAEARGVGFGWLHPEIDFDPARYAPATSVFVRGADGPALLASPFGGEPRELHGVRERDGVRYEVVFHDGPAALLTVAAGDDARAAPAPAPAAPAAPSPPDGVADLGPAWDVELVPTLENDWGDFALPAAPGAPPLERWTLRHRVERAGEDGRRDGWAEPAHDDASWAAAHATFGPHVAWTDPAGVEREAVYSTSRGIHKDLLHQGGTLGPKGHVPEEFLDFGPVAAGDAVEVRLRVDVPDGEEGVLTVGAPAAKRAWVDGAELALDDDGHLAFATRPLGPGSRAVELRLTAEEPIERLRAHVSLVREHAVARCRRPEWIAAAGPPTAGERVALAGEIVLPVRPERAVVQVAAFAPCALRVNGALVGRQGGFDPYEEQEIPRVRRYDVADALRAGRNELTVELAEPAAVLVDAQLGDAVLASGRGWRARRGGRDAAVVAVRRPAGDPAALHLHRRPHPLPGAAWLDPGADDGSVLPLPLAVPREAAASRVEWLRFVIPPGATGIAADVHGAATLFVDGAEQPALALDHVAAPRLGALRIETLPGFEGGGALAAPIRFETAAGTLALGDWEQVGLPEYSGGVRYRGAVELPGDGPAPARAVLDLGRVRGTAEVLVNGQPAGTRICAPWTFDVSAALRPGANAVEVLVLGTLGPYLDAASPTHFVFDGQRTSGMMGPVTLRWWKGRDR